MVKPKLATYEVKEYDLQRLQRKNRIVIASGHYSDAINAIIEAGYHYHHTAASSLNFSDKYAAIVEPYDGKFGIGFKVNVHTYNYAERDWYRQHKIICYYFIAGEHNNAKEN